MLIINRASFCNILLGTSISTLLLETSTKNNNDVLLQASQEVRKRVALTIQTEPQLAGSLLRLAFHDAVTMDQHKTNTGGGSDFDNPYGANGSIRYEISWSENRGLQKPLSYVEELAQDFQNQLSFADVLALSGAAAVEAAHGPHITIRLGRSDVTQEDVRMLTKPIVKGDRSDVTTSLPSAALDSLGLRTFFSRLNLSEAELVALMGAHDLGRHVTLTDMPRDCLRNLTRTCLDNAPVSVPFVTADPDTFSNLYYKKLLQWNDRTINRGEAAFIPTDVALVVDDGLQKWVRRFAGDEKLFFRTFVRAYQKIVDRTATTVAGY